MRLYRLIPIVVFLFLTAFVSDEPVSRLNGAYRQIKNKYGSMPEWKPIDSIKVIKVFRDGYWLGAYYNDKRANRLPFDGACGGTYELKNGKYIETVGFYSWDSTAVGKVYSFDYTVDSKQYQQFGKMNSDKYKDYPINEVSERITATGPLKNSSLEGVWFMREGHWGGSDRLGEGKYKDVQVVKIFSYPMVVYAYYNPKTRQFDGAGGAMYQFDGKTLTETNEFWSWQADGKRKGNKETFRVTATNGQYTQEGWDGKLREVWAKAPVK